MKQIVLNRTGKFDEISSNLTISESEIPEYSVEEVLIRIKYSALNHRDLWISKGLYANIKLPVVLGSDCSGVIEKTGRNVENIKVGDIVFVNPGFNWGNNESFQSKDYRILGMPDNGTLQQYIAVNQCKVHKIPSHLTVEQAAAFPLAGLTAYRALFTKAMIKQGENVLITGIGGGVALCALAFSLAVGANVYVTSGSDEKINKAISLGAMGGVNYKSNPVGWKEKIMAEGGIDVVIDGAGGESLSSAIDVVNPGGRIVSYGATAGNVKNFETRKVFWNQLRLLGTTMGSDKDFAEMINFVERNKIKPQIDKVYPLTGIYEAFKRMDSSSQFGKILINME